MSQSWDFAYLMPHAAFPEPVENKWLALVPADDARLKAIAQQHPAVSKLIHAFTDQFKRKIEPSALLIRSDAPKTVDFYAVASFRNLTAISSVIDAWSFKLSGGSCGYPLWSDYFDFYPFTATKDGHDLIANSVAITELDDSGEFRGQRAPHLAGTDCMSFGTDKDVLEECLTQWERRFVENRNEWESRVLFRSLEVACQASRMPAVGTRTPTIHDVGVGIALWVSAFEILSHPRTRRGKGRAPGGGPVTSASHPPTRKGKANLLTVLALLKQADWMERDLKALRYSVRYRHKHYKVNYLCKLYAELYRARCDFLHGNPVTGANLFPAKDRRKPILLHCAPLVYRAALTSFLTQRRKTSGANSLRGTLSRFFSHTRPYEKALRACQTGTVPYPRKERRTKRTTP